MDVVYVTGNPEKAENFAKHMGQEIAHQPAELDEIQTMDSEELVGHKARQAYAQIGRPVLVEDVELSFKALGGLPGPFVKFFLYGEDGDIGSGVVRMCRMLDGFQDRSAVASCTFGYFDGAELRLFSGRLEGMIADEPRGEGGFGFDKVFMPDGFDGRTAAELDIAGYERYYATIKPFGMVREFLEAGRAIS